LGKKGEGSNEKFAVEVRKKKGMEEKRKGRRHGGRESEKTTEGANSPISASA